MKVTLVATLLAIVILSIGGPFAQAQVQAGSPEDKAWKAIKAETNPDAKAALVADFEKQFPSSKILAALYDDLIAAFRTKDNPAKLIEFAEKAVNADPDDLVALIVLCENYGKDRKDVAKAVAYGQRAVEVISKMRQQPFPIRYKESEWKDWLNRNDAHATALLSWAKSL